MAAGTSATRLDRLEVGVRRRVPALGDARLEVGLGRVAGTVRVTPC
jgi:hypothetical protein